MKIGFDAKRAMENTTGLGHYSRNLVSSLAQYYPGNEYYLYAPKQTTLFDSSHFNNIQIKTPHDFISRLFKPGWRSAGVVRDLKRDGIDIYHGLSHEIPAGLRKNMIRSVVTMHDIIFEIYPDQYKKADRFIYRKKFLHAIKEADHIIAISEQTKRDIIERYKADESKISVCYQSCDAAYMRPVNPGDLERVKNKYGLPPAYFLYVGSIIERKNLLLVCQGLKKYNTGLPLVVIGNGKGYKKKVLDYLEENNLRNRVFFISTPAEGETSFPAPESHDFPAIYQGATAFIYPSIYEGFGIPVLEALWSGTPVITTALSCMPETAGDAAVYVGADDELAMGNAMQQIAENPQLADEMRRKGFKHAAGFTPELCAAAVMKVYERLLHDHR